MTMHVDSYTVVFFVCLFLKNKDTVTWNWTWALAQCPNQEFILTHFNILPITKLSSFVICCRVSRYTIAEIWVPLFSQPIGIVFFIFVICVRCPVQQVTLALCQFYFVLLVSLSNAVFDWDVPDVDLLKGTFTACRGGKLKHWWEHELRTWTKLNVLSRMFWFSQC